MEGFILRLLGVCAVIWLAQVLLGALEIKEPANKIIFVVVVILCVIFLVTGGFLFIR